MTSTELKQQHSAAIAKADNILTVADNARRGLTASEEAEVDLAVAEAQDLSSRVNIAARREAVRNITPITTATPGRRTLSRDYREAFYNWAGHGFTGASAALYEGSNTAGGYAVPTTLMGTVTQLAPQDAAVRKLATVIPTEHDLQFPFQTASGTADLKTESGGSVNVFTGSGPSLGAFKLSAFMAGTANIISLELARDVPSFQTFLNQDVSLDLVNVEENLFVNGSGVGQPQALIGNVGAGVTEEPDASGNLVTINGTLDILDQLKAAYHPNASWLMQRSTSILLRKAQATSNVFEPIFTRSNGQDYLHGYPVEYSAAMPTAARGATPVLFGDFALGYLIGDRGGPGVNVKVLDQSLAAIGQIQILTYRRTDGRVRRPEAIQQYNIAAS